MDIDRAMKFVEGRNKGVLITIKGSGMPQASNITYATFDRAVHVSVTDDRVKTKNLLRDPRGALHVTSDDFWSWVVVEGNAELSAVTTSPDDEAAALLRRVYEAAAGPHPDWDEFNQAMIDQGRRVVSLHIDHTYGQLRD